jgi:hypothetical protein
VTTMNEDISFHHETSRKATEKATSAVVDEMPVSLGHDGDERIDNDNDIDNRDPDEHSRPTTAAPSNRRLTRRQLVQRKQEFLKQSTRESSNGSSRISATPTGLTKSTRLAMFLLVSVQLILGPSSSPVHAQTVGVDICACQPSTYEFVLNFGLTCEEKTVMGAGINASECRITTDRNLNVTDEVPISVSKVQVLELNQNLDIITTSQYNEEFADGDIFTYTSVIASNNITRPQDVPRALQMTITGRNAEEQDLVNFWIIIFDNSCGIYPVVLEGEQIGWTIFVSIGIAVSRWIAFNGRFVYSHLCLLLLEWIVVTARRSVPSGADADGGAGRVNFPLHPAFPSPECCAGVGAPGAGAVVFPHLRSHPPRRQQEEV